ACRRSTLRAATPRSRAPPNGSDTRSDPSGRTRRHTIQAEATRSDDSGPSVLRHGSGAYFAASAAGAKETTSTRLGREDARNLGRRTLKASGSSPNLQLMLWRTGLAS